MVQKIKSLIKYNIESMKDLESSKKNIAVIGGGYWGKNLVRNFYELGVLKTVSDLNQNALDALKKNYPEINTTQKFEDVALDKNIKGVVIATPAATHHQVVKKFLLAGKDVFVEKPLALNIKHGEELVKLAEKQKCILMVGHLLLYHPAVIKLKELIEQGELGKIRYIHSNRLNFGKLRTEENILWSFAPHDIAVIIDLIGKLPKKICSHGMDWLNKNVADSTLSYFEFDKNQAAHIFVSWLNPFKEQKLSVIGEKKMAVFDDQAENKLVVYPHKVEWLGKIPEAKKAEGEIIPLPQLEPLRQECQHFLNCIETRKNPKSDGREALNVLKILNACQKSLDKKGKIINLL